MSATLLAGIGIANSYRRYVGQPSITAIPDQVYDEQSGTQTVTPVYGGLGIVWTLEGSPPAYASIDAGTGVVSIDTNTSGPVSSVALTIRATNGAGIAEDTFNISVIQPKRRPAVVRSQAVARSTYY